MDNWVAVDKKAKMGKLITMIMLVVGLLEAVDGGYISYGALTRNQTAHATVNCGNNPYSRSRCRRDSEFNCSDPQGLPCAEAYGLRDVLDGLNLQSGDRPEFTRLNCTRSTNSISITCTCSPVNNIQVCHVTDITARAVDLSDGIIHENVSRLSHLQHLDLVANHLHCNIPDSLGDLKALKGLDLSDNFIRGPIPSSFGNLASLETLYLSHNMLSGEIPKELGKLSQLVRIDLRENQLKGNLPREFGNLINLKSFAVGSNYLEGILDDNYSKLTSLETFDVGGNNLSGPIPGFISKWENLTTLDLMGNNFEGIPLDIFNMTNLEYLRVSDLKDNRGFVFPEQANLTNIETLVLRNCKITGPIPRVIGNWPSLYLLDLSFNRLNGSIPDALANVSVILLTGNMLTGTIPRWLKEKDDLTDVSYNSLLIQRKIPRNRASNITYTRSPNISPTRDYTAEKKKHCDTLSHNLFINCGGGKQTYEGDEYEEDTSLEKLYEGNETKRWAYSCTGNFLSYNTNASNYIKNRTCGVSDQGLQETARLCPVNLTYYGFCLDNGNYSVKIQFAELLFATDDDYSSRGKRVFDVYIQGEKRLQDFNIKNETGGEANKATTREFVANVHDNQLVIHFYWAGKGSLSNTPLLNGPLISAISVCPNFTISGEKKLSAGQITGITVGSVLAPLLLLAFLWKMGWLGNNELLNVLIKIEENQYFTLQQIVDATRNFSPTTEIGRGRFGIVYKAEFPSDKIVLAVKKISPDLMQDKLKTELHGEIYSLQSLKHDNLIKLYDGYSKKNLHLLIYEYMEKGSLHQAVLDPNPKDVLDWKVRFDICLGLAKALKYLHEDSGLVFLHRNIKASNILLDGTYTAKLTDFGWARLYNEEDPFLTIKAGAARVYIAPEYALGQPITVKADVYSYGVVMLEVFSGRPSIQYKPNQEAAYLLDDARMALAQKRMDKLVDTKMVNYDRKVVYTALNLAIMCINPTANLRPTMSEVVSVLLGEKSLEEITKAHISEAK